MLEGIGPQSVVVVEACAQDGEALCGELLRVLAPVASPGNIGKVHAEKILIPKEAEDVFVGSLLRDCPPIDEAGDASRDVCYNLHGPKHRRRSKEGLLLGNVGREHVESTCEGEVKCHLKRLG